GGVLEVPGAHRRADREELRVFLGEAAVHDDPAGISAEAASGVPCRAPRGAARVAVRGGRPAGGGAKAGQCGDEDRTTKKRRCHGRVRGGWVLSRQSSSRSYSR